MTQIRDNQVICCGTVEANKDTIERDLTNLNGRIDKLVVIGGHWGGTSMTIVFPLEEKEIGFFAKEIVKIV